MIFFRYKEDRLPVLFIVSVFLGDLLVYSLVDSYRNVLSWTILIFVPKLFIGSWNHHHQHCKTFKQTFLNRLLEIVYTFHTGVSTNLWILHHNLGHHINYLDQTKDESGWQRKDGTQMGFFEYTFTIAATGYTRGFGVGKRHQKYQKDFISMGLVNLGLLLILFWMKPLWATTIFLIPMLLSYLGTCATTYFHHVGLGTENHIEASHNIINKFYNIITGNLGYHTAHHMKPGIHWSKLPEYHQSISDNIPAELISKKFPGTGLYSRIFPPKH